MNTWQDMALAEKKRQGAAVPDNVLLATVYAETEGHNITGDGGSATGYGQVWLKWWRDNLNKVAQGLGIALPSDNGQAQKVVLGNDLLSMGLAVSVINDVWANSGGSWDRFTRGYVGDGIPAADLERRRTILSMFTGGTSTPSMDSMKQVTASLPNNTQNLIGYAVVGGVLVALFALAK